MAKQIKETAAQAALESWLKCQGEKSTIEAKRREEMTAIEKLYDGPLMALRTEIGDCEEKLAAYIEQNREHLLGGKQSFTWLGVKIGYQAGRKSVDILDGHDADTVLKQLQKHLPEYVRVKEEIAKTAIMDGFNKGEINLKELTRCGLCILDGIETFFVKA